MTIKRFNIDVLNQAIKDNSKERVIRFIARNYPLTTKEQTILKEHFPKEKLLTFCKKAATVIKERERIVSNG